jgi:hypothetical protein
MNHSPPETFDETPLKSEVVGGRTRETVERPAFLHGSYLDALLNRWPMNRNGRSWTVVAVTSGGTLRPWNIQVTLEEC